MSRTFLSSHLKQRIQHDPRSLGNLAALANLNFAQLSTLMRDQIGVGPIVRAKIVKLGAVLGVPESKCFREVAND
jgi:hypothetical protein